MAAQPEVWTRKNERVRESSNTISDRLIGIELFLVDDNICELKCDVSLRFDNFRPHISINLQSTEEAQVSGLESKVSDLSLDCETSYGTGKEIQKSLEDDLVILVTQGFVECIKLTEDSRQNFEKLYTLPSKKHDNDSEEPEKTSTFAKPSIKTVLWEIQAAKTFIVGRKFTKRPSPSIESLVETLSDRTTFKFVFEADDRTLLELRSMAEILLQQTNALAKFKLQCIGGNVASNKFDARPMAQSRIGYRQLCTFISPSEYVTAMYAGARLDRDAEIKKIEAYEDGYKDLILIKAGDENASARMCGFIPSPRRDECRLQPGDYMAVRFLSPLHEDSDDGECLEDYSQWYLTIVESIGVWKKDFLPVLLHRSSGKSSWLTDEMSLNVIDSSKINHRQLQDTIAGKPPVNPVKVKVSGHDSTFATIKEALSRLAGYTEPKDRCAFESRMLKLLLGQRPDQCPRKDLYQLVRQDFKDIKDVMAPLNDEQKLVVQNSSDLIGGLQIIQGPPGTGKSYLVQQMIAPFLAAKERRIVLVANPTNHGADDLARDIRESLQNLKSRQGYGHTKSRYVLRLHSPSTERAICLSQSAYKPSTIDSTKSVSDTTKRRNRYLMAGEVSKFEGIRDARVEDITFSVGYMMLCRSGIIAKTEFEDHNRDYSRFVELYEKKKRGSKWKPSKKDLKELDDWEGEYAKLFATTIANASVIVSTTHGISVGSLLMNVKDKVAALFFDENAHEREDMMVPLLVTDFALDPCIVLVGDQKQLQPQLETAQRSSGLEVQNVFASQLQLSFMSRMIKLGMPYVMMIEQHRMVEEIAILPSLLTYAGRLTNAASTSVEKRPTAIKFRDFTKKKIGQPCNRLLVDIPTSTTNKTEKIRKSKGNQYFVCFVGRLLEEIAEVFDAGTTIAILTPYSQQKAFYSELKQSLIKHDHPLAHLITLGTFQEIEKLTVGTFDGSQGRQFDIVIVDLPVDKYIGFLADERRMNVAITRARNGLILVCDHTTIQNAKGEAAYLRKLLEQFEGKTWKQEKSDTYPVTKFFKPRVIHTSDDESWD